MTLRELIEKLSQQAPLPDGYVQTVVDLLRSKNLSLEDDAGPYQDALTQSFQFRAELHARTTYIKKQLADVAALLKDMQHRSVRIVINAQRAEDFIRGAQAQSQSAAAPTSPSREKERERIHFGVPEPLLN